MNKQKRGINQRELTWGCEHRSSANNEKNRTIVSDSSPINGATPIALPCLTVWREIYSFSTHRTPDSCGSDADIRSHESRESLRCPNTTRAELLLGLLLELHELELLNGAGGTS